MPPEALSTIVFGVHVGKAAACVPESAAVEHCTVVREGRVTGSLEVVVTVIRGEHHPVVRAKCIPQVSREPGEGYPIVGCLV